LYSQGVRLAINAVGGIGDLTIRVQVFQKLARAGFTFPAVLHPTAFVESSSSISAGVQVFPHSYVGSDARIGFGCIINTNAVVSHDCILDDYANISPGALLAGEVRIGNRVLVGMGATINLRVQVGAGARIGNGATVKEDVPEKGIVRAGASWPD
jgi:sugar O-acyltransferase (sialic acid O-acetyltransferase NeuD family)